MTVSEHVITRLAVLSEEQRRQVLEFITQLEPPTKTPLIDPYGLFADLRTDLSFEEFKQHRQEMWGHATDGEF